MVRIRLRRVGPKKQPSYRVVVIDRKKARDSRYIESIGFYNPRTVPATMTLQEDRALYWLSVGAQPSEAVEHLLRQVGTAERFARLKGGESLETLVAEAEAQFEAAEPISGKTRFPAPARSAKKADDAVAEIAAEDVEADLVEDTEEEEAAEVEGAADDVSEEAADDEAEAEAEESADDEAEEAADDED